MSSASNKKSLMLSAALAAAIAVLATGCNRQGEDATMGKAPSEPPSLANATNTVKGEINDTMVTTSVKSALLADDQVKGLEIKVETQSGQVALSGFVDSQSQIDRAVTVARGVDGVKDVQNGLTLKNGVASTMGEKIDDGVTTTKVKAALLADSQVKGTDISVTTMDGKVQLSGFVDSSAQADRAVQLARGIQGVTDVNNELTVKK